MKELIEPIYEVKDDEKETKKELSVSFGREEKKHKKLINPILFDDTPKNFEEKTYIILEYLYDGNENDYVKQFEIIVGRTAVYKYIAENAEYMDIHKSILITETKQTETETGERKYYLLPLDKSISVYYFCKHTEQFYQNIDFDIEDYNYSDEEEEIEDNTNSKTTNSSPESLDIWNALLSSKNDDSLTSKYNEDEEYNQDV